MDSVFRRRLVRAGTLLGVTGLAGCGYRSAGSFLALGDSYTVGTGVSPDERWANRLVDRLGQRGVALEAPTVIATNGWTTDDLATAIDRRNPDDDHDLVTLCIGANDAFQGRDHEAFVSRFRDLLGRAIEFAGEAPENTLVLTIPDYTLTPVGQQNDPDAHAERLEVYNRHIREEATARNVGVVDLVPPSREVRSDPELVAGDGLHPSPKQHGLWLERITPAVAGILQE